MSISEGTLKMKQEIQAAKADPMYEIKMKKTGRSIKNFLMGLLKLIIIVGISYIILGPVITMVSNSFFTENDLYNPVVVLLPAEGTVQNYIQTFKVMTYVKTLGSTIIYVLSLTLIQILICSMAGYGFARFDFPFKKVLFACVILTIVIPTDSIMLPLYTEFRNFDIFGIIHLIKGESVNLLGTRTPMYIMTALGCGLRSGLYIYIFNQFFRGLPKEIEEAAVVDGAGAFYTYFRIMLINAMPSVLTVSIFSLVWQYNDVFYSKLFAISSKVLMSIRISTVQATLENALEIKDSSVSQLYLYSGIVMMIIPILLIYILLQRRFIEGVERSGIVG